MRVIWVMAVLCWLAGCGARTGLLDYRQASSDGGGVLVDAPLTFPDQNARDVPTSDQARANGEAHDQIQPDLPHPDQNVPDLPPTDTGGTTTYNASLLLTADDAFEVWVNGKLMGQGNNWQKQHSYSFSLHSGKNVVAVHAWDEHSVISGFIGALVVNGAVLATGMPNTWVHVSGLPAGAWQASGYNDASWAAPVVVSASDRASWSCCSQAYYNLGAKWVWNNKPRGLGKVSFRLKVTLP